MSNPAIMLYVPFALNGIKSSINVTRATGQADQDATWNDGFPSITMIPEGSGGKAPNGQDFNGIFYALSLDVINRQKGQRPMFDATYATNIGGYSKGAVLLSTSLNKEYISTVDNNLTDPDSSLSSGWSIYSGAGSVPLATSTISGTAKLVNNLTSDAIDAALTAAQGKIIADSFKNNLSANGYQKIFGGLIIQWGTVDYSTSTGEIQVDITFPIAFTTSCLNIVATRKMLQQSSNGDGGVNLISQNKNGASFSLQRFTQSNSDLRGFNWFAIGY